MSVRESWPNPAAIEQTEVDCLADAEVRKRNRVRSAEPRAHVDERLSPRCPPPFGAQFPGMPAEWA